MCTDNSAFAHISFLAKYRSRRLAKRELREAGGKGTAEELDAVLRVIAESPDREAIERQADELGAAWQKAESAHRPDETPASRGRGIDEWIVGEGCDSRRMYIQYLGLDTAFIGEVFDSRDDVPLGREAHTLDEGQVMANIVWLDDPPGDRERVKSLFATARKKLRDYDAMQARDAEELEDNS